jgi:putative transposase
MPDHVHFIIFLEGNVEKAASLGRVVGIYKSLTTLAWLRHIEATRMERSGRFWQHNYYEHIIHGAEELEKIRQYIRHNPSKPGKFDTDGQGQMGCNTK